MGQHYGHQGKPTFQQSKQVFRGHIGKLKAAHSHRTRAEFGHADKIAAGLADVLDMVPGPG